MGWINKIVHLTLAGLLLLATTGVTLNKHYCMGRLKSIAINLPVHSCCDTESEKMPCCENTSEHFQVDDEQYKFSGDIDLKPKLYLVALIEFFLPDYETTDGPAFDNYGLYKPPVIAQDIPVTVQSFLL